MRLYIVKSPAGRVWVVVAQSANDAAEVVARSIADSAQISIEVAREGIEQYEVGRLGSYDPGITGQRLMGAAGGIVG